MDFSLSVTQQAVLAMETLRATTASPLTSRPFSSSSFHPPRLHLTPSSHPSSFPGSLSLVRAQNGGGFDTKSLSGVIFEPFVEAQNHLVKVASTSSESFARQNYSTSSEAAINDQINIEYTVSYVYHSLFAYFDRDYVGLPGFARFFKKSSDEERHHAEKLIRYQNLRGGKVRLQSIMAPGVSEFDHTEKGDALYAMEVSLALEKLVNEKLLRLHKVAIDNNDPQMQDFVESEFLHSQVEDIKKISTYVSQLRRVGKGHGVYHFDSKLQEENEGEAAAVDGMLVANGAAA